MFNAYFLGETAATPRKRLLAEFTLQENTRKLNKRLIIG